MKLIWSEVVLLCSQKHYIRSLIEVWPHFEVLLHLLEGVDDVLANPLPPDTIDAYHSVLEAWVEAERHSQTAKDAVLRDHAAIDAFRASADSFRRAQERLVAVAQMLDPSNIRPKVPSLTGFLLVHRFLLQMPAQFQDTGCGFCALCLRCINDGDAQLIIASSHLQPASVQKEFIPVLKLPSSGKKQRDEGFDKLLLIPPTREQLLCANQTYTASALTPC